MKSRLHLAAAALLVAVSSASAQFSPDRLAPSDSAFPTFADMQRSFAEWSRGRDLRAERGWKWYKRWEAFTEQRTLPEGRLPDAATVWRGTAQALALKEKQAASLASAGSGWLPVGPSALAMHPSPEFVKGIGRINCIAFHPTDSSTFWVGVAQGGVWKTVDGGASWRPLTDDLPVLRISDIAVDPNDPDVIYVSVGDYAYLGLSLTTSDRKRHTHHGLGVYKTTDGGESWNPTGLSFNLTHLDASLIRRIFVDPESSSRLLALGFTGTWTSTDAGATWTRGRLDFIWDAERHASAPHTILATTGYLSFLGPTGAATIVRSTDFGATWTTLPSTIPTKLAQRIEIAIAPSDPQYVYALASGSGGGLYGFYRSTDGGSSWTATAQRPLAPNILGWQNGLNDNYSGQGTYDLAINVDPLDPNRVFTGGINLWGSEDGGSTWGPISYWQGTHGPGVHADQHQIAVHPITKAIYVCNDGGLQMTRRMVIGSWAEAANSQNYTWPTEWVNLSNGMAVTSFYRLGLSRNNPGYVVAGAQDNSTFYFDGEKWRQLFGGDGMDCLIDPVDPRIVYGSSQYGWLHGTIDGGDTEREGLTFQVLEEYNEDAEWTTPYAMHPNEPTTLYAGYGNLYRSRNNDQVWAPISSFPALPQTGAAEPMTAISISQADPRVIYIAKKPMYGLKRKSQVWMTPDEGGTWVDATPGLPDSLYPTSITTHRTDANTAWVTYAGYTDGVKVFRTTDAGQTWTNLSWNLPNLPVNAIVHDGGSGNNAIYIGTDVGVFTTNDAMDGWAPFMENLPNVIVSDLEIHDISREIYAATFGRGIWASALPAPASVASDAAASGLQVSVTRGATTGSIVVETVGATQVGHATLEIVDVLGRRVAVRDIDVPASTHRSTHALGLTSGLYFARIAHAHGSKVVRFVVE